MPEGENATLRAALLTIWQHDGQVCDTYDLCDHPACQSSYGAWAIADAALRGDD